jgi:putative peptidoglycan lipid II flippase
MSDNQSPENPLTASPSPAEDPGRALTSSEIARAAGIVMIAFVLSGILGLVRNAILSRTFGAGTELDAFNAALRVPETLFTLVAGGALGSAFIPVFSRFLNRDEFDKAWALAGSTISLVIGAATISATLGFVLAEPITRLLLIPGAHAAEQDLTIELMRIMLATVVLFGTSGLLMGILNAHQRFTAPALAPSMYNVGIIFGAIALAPSLGIQGVAWGAVIGAGLHMAAQLPSVLKLPYRTIRLRLSLKNEGVTEVLSLMGPRVLGLMVVQVNFWVNAALSSSMGQGSLTALAFSFTLMFTVLGVLGQSLGTAVFPTLSTLHAQEDFDGFRRTLSTALRNVLFLSIPAGFGLVIMSRPIVQFLFEGADWTPADTRATAWALVFYGIGLAGHAALEILARTFYAVHDTWTPVVIGGSAMILNVILSFAFIEVFSVLGADRYPIGPFGGLALANSVATAIESTVLWLILKRRLPAMESGPILLTLGRTGLAGLGMLAAVWAWLQIGTPLVIELTGGILLGVAVFAGLAFLLRIPEAVVVPTQLKRRFGRS